MRITQVCPKYFPALGGVEEVVKQYSERLVKRGYIVSVITGDADLTKARSRLGGTGSCHNSRSREAEIINGVQVRRACSLRLPLEALSPAPGIVPLLLKSQADIFHLHANKYFTTDLGALICRLKKWPFVFNPHAGTFGDNSLGVIHNNTIGRLALGAKIVICVSQYEKSLIKNSGIAVKRLEVLPNGVDTEEFSTPVEFNFFSKLNLENRPIIFYLGRLAVHKGLDVLLSACRQLFDRNSAPVLVISGPDVGALESLKRRSISLGLENRVFFTGKLNHEEKISALQHASVFCLPSYSEAFGVTVIEAMAAGCPVVATNIMSLPEIVAHQETGLLFRPGDGQLLFENLKYLLDNKEERGRLSTNAKIKVKRDYDWENIVDRLESLYKQVIA